MKRKTITPSIYTGVLEQPSINFQAVRDNRRSTPFYVDVDLSTARSITANTALLLPISGNVFFSDKDPVNQGVAIVHFQDVNLDKSSAPIYVERGFIARVPFTQLLIENAAQPGMRLRIIFGTDLDLLPGVGGIVTVSGNVAILDAVASNNQHIFDFNTIAVGTNVSTLIAAGTNTNGILLKGWDSVAITATAVNAQASSYLMAASAPPADLSSGANRVIIGGVFSATSAAVAVTAQQNNFALSRRLPVGWGVYIVNTALVGVGSYSQKLEYSLL